MEQDLRTNFSFSVEEHTGEEPLVLRRSRRYAHSERYILDLAARNGFDVHHVARAPIRDHGWEPIAGLYAWLAPTLPR